MDGLAATTDISAAAERALRALPLRIQAIGVHHEVIREGDHLTESCLVIDGFLCRHHAVADRRQILSFHLPSDLPDLQSLFIDVMDYSLAALTNATVAFIPHAAIRRAMEDEPELVGILWRSTLVDAAIFRAWLSSVGSMSAAARVAHLFCELFVRMKATGNAEAMGFELPLSQSEIADALGLSTVHVNRTLQELRREGLIRSNGKYHRFDDWPGLVARAHFDPAYLQLRKLPAL